MSCIPHATWEQHCDTKCQRILSKYATWCIEFVHSAFHDFGSVMGEWDFISSTARKLLLYPLSISIFKYRKERSNIVKTMDRQLLGEHQISWAFPIWPFLYFCCIFSSFWVISKKSRVPRSQQKHNHVRHLPSSSAGMKIAASRRACTAAVWVRFDWSDKSHCIVSIPLAQGMCKHFKTECLCMRTLNQFT